MKALFTFFDENFSKYAKILVPTFIDHNPRARVFCFAINASTKTKKWLNKTKKVTPVYKKIKFPSPKVRRIYCSSERFIMFSDYLKRRPDIRKVITIDVDAWIKRSLDPIYEKLRNHDLLANYRTNKKSHRKRFISGLIAYRNNKKMHNFWEHYKSTLRVKRYNTGWYVDQISLSIVMQSQQNKIKWNKLPADSQSVNIEDNTMIFQARGKRKGRWKEKWKAYQK